MRFGFGEDDFDDVLESLFGRGAGARCGGFGGGFAARGADHEAKLELSLEDAARGGRRSLSLTDGRILDIEIPAGVRDGQRIRLAGHGGEGAGGGAGDLLLHVRIRPHPRLRLEGRDLHVDVPVAPWEAALGAEVDVPTLEGTTRVRVPAGSSSGRRLRLRGQGFPGPRGGRGDLYATVSIVTPKRLSDRERDLFRQLAEASSFDPRAGVR